MSAPGPQIVLLFHDDRHCRVADCIARLELFQQSFIRLSHHLSIPAGRRRIRFHIVVNRSRSLVCDVRHAASSSATFTYEVIAIDAARGASFGFRARDGTSFRSERHRSTGALPWTVGIRRLACSSK